MKNRYSHLTRYQHQAGAVLIISLILLMVMTLIGVSAAKSTVMEIMMTANTQFQVRSLADVEVTVRTGEQDIDAIVSDSNALVFENQSDHYYFTGQFHIPNLTNEGSYGVEYVGARRIAGESGEMGSATAGVFIHVFSVNAQNESGKGASRNVQSVYLTRSAP